MTATCNADEFLQRLEALAGDDGPRRLVALVGAPGSGKSTLAEQVVSRLGARAALLPMDGYHFDDRVLEARGHRARKGAPHTFDVGGLAAMLDRLRADEEDEIAIPVFDREIEIARAGAAIIPRAARLIVVEGNWLLRDRAPWDVLAARFSLTAMLDVEESVLRQRLEERWVHHGLDAEARAVKLEENDLPNARTVIEESRAPDLLIR